MASELFSLSWDDFHKSMSSGMSSLLESEDLVDVTIAVEGRYLKAHKMVLSVCSPYFRELFKVTPCKHPIVFLKDVSYTAMSELLQFMYQGEVQVSHQNLTTFISTAEALQIRGLTADGNKVDEISKKNHMEETETELQESSSAKPRLEETFDTVQTKTEPIVEKATDATSSEHMTFKVEPDYEDQSMSTVDDNLVESFTDINEYDTMMESGDEESKEETNTDWPEEGQDSLAVTEKSKVQYEQIYLNFQEWLQQRDEKTISEPLMLEYFQEKAKTKKSSTLWCYYSMLRTMIFRKKEIDIRNYTTLGEFLKRTSIERPTKKSKLFTKQDIEKFLRDADDYHYLLMKIVLMFLISGGCKREELIRMSVDDIKDEGKYIQIVIPTRTGDDKEFILTDGSIKGFSVLETFRKYANLRCPRTDHRRFLVNYRNGKCISHQPLGINYSTGIPSKIAHFLKLENPRQYKAIGFRKLSSLFLAGSKYGSVKYWKDILS